MKNDPIGKFFGKVSPVEFFIGVTIVLLLLAVIMSSFTKARETARAGQAGPVGEDYQLWCKINPNVHITFDEWKRARQKGMLK